MGGALQLLIRDSKRRGEGDDVAMFASRKEDVAALKHFRNNGHGEISRGQFETGHETQADILGVRRIVGGEEFFQKSAEAFGTRDEFLFL